MNPSFAQNTPFYKSPKFLGGIGLLVLTMLSLGIYILFPKYFTSHFTPVNSTPVTAKPSNLICPMEKEFCKNGKDIIINDQYIGFGIDKISTGSAVLAAFDGTLTSGKMTTASQEEFIVLSIVNEETKKQAFYWFKGSHIQPKGVLRGEVIATSSGQAISSVQDQKLVFNLIYSANGNTIKLKPEDFEK